MRNHEKLLPGAFVLALLLVSGGAVTVGTVSAGQDDGAPLQLAMEHGDEEMMEEKEMMDDDMMMKEKEMMDDDMMMEEKEMMDDDKDGNDM